MMPRSPGIARRTLVTALIATMSSQSEALLQTDVESLARYGGIATLTVTRTGPTPSSSASGTAADISGTTTFSIAWTSGGSAYASALAGPDDVPLYAINFGAVLPGNAPTSLGSHVFDLSRPASGLDIGDLDLGGPGGGELDELLALIAEEDERASWSDRATQGIFTATYNLVLFATSAPHGNAGDPIAARDVEVTAVAEPGVVALIGAALLGMGLGRRRR